MPSASTLTAGDATAMEGEKMKPCDVKSIQDYDKLSDQGLSLNSRSIGIDSNGVILEINPYFKCRFNHKIFKKFAEWYLEDQE